MVAGPVAKQFASPNYNNGHYAKDLNCVWFIESTDGMPVFLSFQEFALEEAGTNGCVDKVEIGGGMSGKHH